MLCMHGSTLRSILRAEDLGFGTSSASVSPAAVVFAHSQGLAPPSEVGCLGDGWLALQTPWPRRGGRWVSEGFGRGAWSGGEQGGSRLLQIPKTRYVATIQHRSLINLVIMCCQV